MQGADETPVGSRYGVATIRSMREAISGGNREPASTGEKTFPLKFQHWRLIRIAGLNANISVTDLDVFADVMNIVKFAYDRSDAETKAMIEKRLSAAVGEISDVQGFLQGKFKLGSESHIEKDDIVVFVDRNGQEHLATVTTVWTQECVNLYVDDFGEKQAQPTSVPRYREGMSGFYFVK